jgi:transglutaminase-like putative cysteine protease
VGFVAALAVALSATTAAAAAGGAAAFTWQVPTLVYVVLLLPGLALAFTRGPGWSRPRTKGHEAVFSVVLIVSAVLVVAGFSRDANSVATLPAAVIAVVLISAYWPDPLALGIGLLASFVYLVTGRHGAGAAVWTAAAVATGAFAAVAIARLYRAQLPTFGRSVGPDWRRTARDGAIVLVIAGLFGVLLAAVLPPPPPRSGASDTLRPDAGTNALNPLGIGPQLDLGGSRTRGDDSVMLRVAAPEADVWRAATFESWNGRGWRFSSVAVEDADPAGSQDFQVPLGPGDVIGRVGGQAPLRQRVTIETDFAHVIVAAPRPARVVAPTGSYVLDYAGLLVLGPVMRRHSSYQVDSTRSLVDPDRLRLSDRAGTPIPEELEGYTAPPPGFGQISRLASTITSAAPTTYDKVTAVSTWLATNTRLTDSDHAVPRGTDVVSQLLFVDHAGRVERVATALVVMLRTQGIPARLAVGFRTGQRSGPGEPFTVRARDAAAWAEVWFPGAGWQRFDPTGFLAAPTTSQSPSIWSRLWDAITRFWPALVFVVVAVAAVVLCLRVRRRRAIEAQPWPTRFYAQLLRAGAKRHRPRRAHETPVEYTTALAESALPDPRLVTVGQLITSAAFSGRTPTADEERWAERVLEDATSKSPSSS